MDTTLINSYERVLEDMSHDTELAPDYRDKLLKTLNHRLWELENFDTFDTDEDN